MMMMTLARIGNISGHQMFSGERVSACRVAPRQTHSDWPSAQNQLTDDLLAVILFPLPLSHNPLGIWHLCGPRVFASVPNLPRPPFLFFLNYSFDLQSYNKDVRHQCFVSPLTPLRLILFT